MDNKEVEFISYHLLFFVKIDMFTVVLFNEFSVNGEINWKGVSNNCREVLNRLRHVSRQTLFIRK